MRFITFPDGYLNRLAAPTTDDVAAARPKLYDEIYAPDLGFEASTIALDFSTS